MNISALYWREPLWLLATLLPLLAVFIRQFRLRRSWRQLADAELLPWVRSAGPAPGQTAPALLMGFGWLLLCTALAGPRTAQSIPPALQMDRAAMVVVIDLSASMQARDAHPDRVGRALAMLEHWLQQLPAAMPVGLVVYAGHAHPLLPPTTDHRLARHFVQQLAGLKPPTLGNNLADALQQAAAWLAEYPHNRHLVLFSDGDLDKPAAAKALATMQSLVDELRLQLAVIGVGGSEPVSVPFSATEPLIIDGKQVVSRRNAQWLGQFAAASAGIYRDIEALDRLSAAEILNLPDARIDPAQYDQVRWREWFAIPLLIGMALILFALQISAAEHRPGRSKASLLLAMFLGGCQGSSQLPPETGAVMHALHAEDYASVRELAGKSTGYAMRYAEGVACYRLQDYACALQSFSRAAWIAPDDRKRGRAVFNLGNTYFKLGDYPQAAVLFTDAENLGVDAEKTRINRAFANSLAESVRRYIADIAETERRAEWRAAAHEIPAELADRMADGITLSRPSPQSPLLGKLGPAAMDGLLQRGVQQMSGSNQAASGLPGRPWVLSPQSQPPQQTAGLFMRLLPMEIGLPIPPQQALRIKTQRPW